MATGTQAYQARQYQEYQIHHMSLDLAFGDNNTAKGFPYRLPGGAIVTNVQVAVTTLFNDSGTDLVKVGTTSGGSELAASVDVSSVGVKLPTTLATAAAANINPSADTQLYAQYNGQNSDMTTGACTVIVSYIIKG